MAILKSISGYSVGSKLKAKQALEGSFAVDDELTVEALFEDAFGRHIRFEDVETPFNTEGLRSNEWFENLSKDPDGNPQEE